MKTASDTLGLLGLLRTTKSGFNGNRAYIPNQLQWRKML